MLYYNSLSTDTFYNNVQFIISSRLIVRYQYQENMYLTVSGNSEANTSEFLEIVKEMLHWYYISSLLHV